MSRSVSVDVRMGPLFWLRAYVPQRDQTLFAPRSVPCAVSDREGVLRCRGPAEGTSCEEVEMSMEAGPCRAVTEAWASFSRALRVVIRSVIFLLVGVILATREEFLAREPQERQRGP